MVGTVDVDGLLESMPEDLLHRWRAYDQVEPLTHGDRMLGLLATLVASIGGQKLMGNPYMPWVPE